VFASALCRNGHVAWLAESCEQTGFELPDGEIDWTLADSSETQKQRASGWLAERNAGGIFRVLLQNAETHARDIAHDESAAEREDPRDTVAALRVL
jgi:hypothetical protein